MNTAYWFLWLCSINVYARNIAPPPEPLTYGTRPFYLIDTLDDGPLKSDLTACRMQTPRRSDFVVSHRGAPLMYPEHTRESYLAAIRSGAGLLECDVTFTKDKHLVCRHSQADLHATTNILATPLAKKCHIPFTPAKFDSSGKLLRKARAECRTSDITLGEFKTLRGKMDGVNEEAQTVEEYMRGTPAFRTDLFASDGGTLMTHKESIELFRQHGVKMVPELKEPVVDMPYDGFTQSDYARKLIEEYVEARVPASDVFPQSFNLKDIEYWLTRSGDYGKQAVLLDQEFDNMEKRIAAMPEWRRMGVTYLAPAIPMLVMRRGEEIVPSLYAEAAKDNGFKLISWSFERAGPLREGGGWYYKPVKELMKKDSDMLKVLDALAKRVGIIGLFSDWPATVAYYANCKGL